jgi:hypothetical protein
MLITITLFVARDKRTIPGIRRALTIASTNKKRGLERPEVLRALDDLEKTMLLDLSLGGAEGTNIFVSQIIV